MIHLPSWQGQKGKIRSLISNSSLSSGEYKHINTSLQSYMVNTMAVVYLKSHGSIEEEGINYARHLGRMHRGGDI